MQGHSIEDASSRAFTKTVDEFLGDSVKLLDFTVALKVIGKALSSKAIAEGEDTDGLVDLAIFAGSYLTNAASTLEQVHDRLEPVNVLLTYTRSLEECQTVTVQEPA